MNLREITIGRNKECDIYLDSRCKYASNLHGTIYYDGNQMMFKDNSTNGTMINNVNVHHRAVPIKRGDIIMLAGKYQLNWNQIDSFFPYRYQNVSHDPFEKIVNIEPSLRQQNNHAEPLTLSKWSWGAFVLSWIWGFFNGCWWIFLVKLGFFLLSVLLWWVPFAIIFILIADMGTSILFGVKGMEWAWNNRKWNSVEDFNQTQRTWNNVGLVLFLLGIFLSIFSLVFFFATISSLFYMI